MNSLCDVVFHSSKTRANPFVEVTLDVEVTDPEGKVRRFPAYWAGGREWRARLAPFQAGPHRYRTVCSDVHDSGLHGREGNFDAVAPAVNLPLRVSADRRHLERADGAPFFWLGDTWWTALSARLRWPDEFQELAADRKAKGFTLLQIVIGAACEDDLTGSRSANEGGLPWTPGFASINPAYFEMADRRLRWLAAQGFHLLLFPGWGYLLRAAGAAQVQRYLRHLLARYGDLPVTWCLAGEFSMPYYLSTDRDRDRATQIAGWSEIARAFRAADPWKRLITIHPEAPQHSRAFDEIADLLDVDLIQIGHAGNRSKQFVRPLFARALARSPRVPVINAEACYEGIAEVCPDRLVRHMFWSSFLLGGCGFSYGANGIWQINRTDAPYGLSPHGISWGDQPWNEAMQFPGATQVGLGRRLLERYPWWRFEPRPDWLRHSPADYEKRQLDPPCCAGIPREVRFLYFSDPVLATPEFFESVVGLEAGVRYRAFFFNPKTGREHDLGVVQPDAACAWPVPTPPILMDWVLVLERCVGATTAASV